MPPTAAKAGSSALRTFDSAPTYTPRSSSRPIIRKNIAISASLIQCSTLSGPSFRCQRCDQAAANRRVGERQRYDGARHQQDAPELLGLDESPEGLMQHHGCANFSRE